MCPSEQRVKTVMPEQRSCYSIHDIVSDLIDSKSLMIE
ncbi:hypothetical protein Pan110_12960 [Gimesia panareensis]|nr:hypothetical protein Pan110_12960 [Gimesia panareensis]